MKKLLLLFVAMGVGLFGACENSGNAPEERPGEKPGEEIVSLAGTTWRVLDERNDGSWIEEKMVFTSTYATYTFTASNGNTWTFAHEYTYVSPGVTILIPMVDMDGLAFTRESAGTVKGETMKILIWDTPDVCHDVELKKQKFD